MSSFKLHPRLVKDTYYVADLNLCKLILMNDSNYPWLILVPKINNISELYELDDKSQLILNYEINQISKRLKIYFNAKKMNIANLGNIVSQLHIHVIARNERDVSWPNPIWNSAEILPYTNNNSSKLISDIRELIKDMIISV